MSSNLGSKKAGIIKTSILALTAAALQACSPAQAAENPQDKAQVIKVAANNAETSVIDTVISSGETGGSVEKEATRPELVGQLVSLIEQTMEGERKEDWLATMADFEDFGLMGLDDEDVLKFATADDNKALNIFLKLKGQDADFDDFIDNIKAKSDNTDAKSDNTDAKSDNTDAKSDLEYVTKLADSLSEK